MNILYNIIEELTKYGLTTKSYEELLQDCSNKVHKLTDIDWYELCQKYNLDFNPDTVRKGSQPPIIGSVFVAEYYKWKEKQTNVAIDDNNYLKEVYAIRKERQKLYDDRLDINKRIRQLARLETTVENIEKMLSEISNTRYEPYSPIAIESDNDIIVCLSDLHIGAEYYGFDGVFNSDIAKQRLSEYISNIIEIQKTHNAKNCYVVLLGDLISGNIHKTISVTNKENVIEQIKLACEYISDFIYEIGKHFSFVEVHAVSGNHSRIDHKEDALLAERLDVLIPWFIKSILNNQNNIKVCEEEIDDTLSSFFIRNKLYFAVHGDFDASNAASVAKLSLWTKTTPYCILCGHKHFPAMNDLSGIKVVQSGSLCGSGDEYTRQKRLTGKPSQTVLVVNNKGLKACYPIELG